MKAKFMERQPAVRWQPVNDGMVDVAICLNEKKVTVEQGGGMEEGTAPMQMWEYDFNQFREKAEILVEADVRATPATYLTYTPYKEPSYDEKMATMQMNNDMAIAELSILISQLMAPVV